MDHQSTYEQKQYDDYLTGNVQYHDQRTPGGPKIPNNTYSGSNPTTFYQQRGTTSENYTGTQQGGQKTPQYQGQKIQTSVQNYANQSGNRYGAQGGGQYQGQTGMGYGGNRSKNQYGTISDTQTGTQYETQTATQPWQGSQYQTQIGAQTMTGTTWQQPMEMGAPAQAQSRASGEQIQGPQFSDRDRINDLLSSEKYLTTGYIISLNEMINPQIYQTVKQILNETHDFQHQLFTAMQQKGWYDTPSAQQQEIEQAKQKFSNYRTQFPYS